MEITAEQVIIGPRAAVAEHGEHTVRGCRYIVNSQPSRIAGVVLHALGVTIRTLELMEGLAINADAPVVLYEKGFELTEVAEHVLATAQKFQDAGYAWGHALEEAEAVAESAG